MGGSFCVELSLLNGFEVRLDGVAVAVARGSQRLLAFVAVSGGRTSRERIYTTLWPDSDDHRASGNLRSALWRLPPAVREAVEVDGGEVRLAPEVRCDIAWFASLAGALMAKDGPPPAAVDVRVLHHDLLPTWYDDWVLLERERFRQLRMHALESLALTLRKARRFGEAIDAALVAIAAEPLRESAHRCLIEAHLAEGNQSEAVCQFERYRMLLASELGAEPSAALCRLLDGLQRAERAGRGLGLDAGVTHVGRQSSDGAH